jgi:hypothetical protein
MEDAYTGTEGPILRGCIPGPKGSILRNPNSHGQNYDAAIALTRKNRSLHYSDFAVARNAMVRITIVKIAVARIPMFRIGADFFVCSFSPSPPFPSILLLFYNNTCLVQRLLSKVEEWH